MIRSLFKSQRGSAIIEFAFVAPVLFWIAVSIGDLGLYVTAQIRLANAVSAGAVYAQTYYLGHFPTMNAGGPTYTYTTYVQTTGQTVYAAWVSSGLNIQTTAPSAGISPVVTVSFNNAISATNQTTSSFPASNMVNTPTDNTVCYCPNATNTAIDISATANCNTACPSAANIYPGKYTTITASYNFIPFFTSSMLLGSSKTITESAIVRVQ